MRYIITLIHIGFNAYILLIIFRVFLSWGFIPGTSWVYRFVWKWTEPLLKPVRKILLPYTIRWRIDLSPAVVILLLLIIRNLLIRIIYSVF